MAMLVCKEKSITTNIVLNCSAELLWWKWTTHEGVKSFFGVENKIKLKIGGPFEIYFSMDEPEGLRGSEGCKILSYLPNKMLSFTWNAPPIFPQIRNHEYKTWVVVNFFPVDKNRTEVELNHIGWLEGKGWDEVFNYFNTAWTIVMEWLKTSCKNEN
jgi:uncharacterized protein YndB with AHSA1/START domain